VFLVAKRKANKNIRVDKPEVVKESNAIARAQLRPQAESVWEERIISQIVAFNRVDDEDFPEADFMLGRLVDGRKKISGYVFQQIGKAVERLASTTYTIYHSRKKYDIFPIFSRISYDNGIISAKLNPELKPYFLQLRREFSMRSLPEFRRLSSIYAQQIYRFLCSVRALEETVVEIERLHFTTTAPESLKADFRKFRTRVLEPAEKEINSKTNLKFRWEPIRQGRKVVAVRFIFNGGAAAEAVDRAAVSGDEELKKWQRLSNACYERHAKAGTTCKPRGGHKCTYCRTRGRMAFRGDTTE
jgi:hypothetical protein